MVDEFILIIISAILTAIGYFAVKWMSTTDALLSSIRRKLDSLNGAVTRLSQDHVSVREYLADVHDIKNNELLLQNRLNDMEKELNAVKEELTRISIKVMHYENMNGGIRR